jgi:hypothetical protein
MCRECFARYLKLTRRALSDASAVAAATAAGITAAGQPLQPLDGLLAAAAQAAASEEGYGGSRRAPLDDCVAAGMCAPPLRLCLLSFNACCCWQVPPADCCTMPIWLDAAQPFLTWLGLTALADLSLWMHSIHRSSLCAALCTLDTSTHTPPASADWGATGLLEGLYVVKTDLVRLDSLLPELSPRDRGSELVEHTVRQHVSLCFAALERRLLATVDALSAALAGAGGAPPRGGNGGGAEARRRLVAQGLALLQALLVQGLEWLLRRWV